MLSATLDTNIYVSALEFGGVGARVLGMARAGVFRIDVSDVILAELVTVLRDGFRWGRIRLHFAKEQIARLANRVVPTQTLDVIKEDPDDDRILECAVEARSAFIGKLGQRSAETRELRRCANRDGQRVHRDDGAAISPRSLPTPAGGRSRGFSGWRGGAR